MNFTQATQEIAKLRRLFHLLAYTQDVPNIWQRLVTERKIVGKQSYDARLVAVMHANAVTNVLTFNTAHRAVSRNYRA